MSPLKGREIHADSDRGFIFYLDLFKLSELDKNSLRMERI